MGRITKADAQEVLAHRYGVERAKLDAPGDGVYAKPLVPAPTRPLGLRAPRAVAGQQVARLDQPDAEQADSGATR